MTTEGSVRRSGSLARLSPSWIAIAGAVVAVVLLLLPIWILGPGDHETKSCGNALSMNLDRWRNVPDGNYWDRAHRACTTQRIDRVAWALLVVTVTASTAAVAAARLRRRDSITG
jgi:hypothetical protein